MRSTALKLVALVVSIVAITWGAVVLVRCGGPGVGRPIHAELVTAEQGRRVLALTDHLDDEDSIRVRTARVDLDSGELIDRETRHGEATAKGPPEQRCESVLAIPGRPATTIDPRVEPLGFLASDGIPLMDGGDTFLHHRFAFGPQRSDEKRGNWVSRIDAQGRPVWSYRLVAGCQLAIRHGQLLILALASGHHRAIALDVTSGLLRWQFDR
jgi:hypothetical protein